MYSNENNKCIYTGIRNPIIYSLDKLAYIRKYLAQDKTLEEKLEMVNTLEKEVLGSLYTPHNHITHEPLKYNMNEKCSRIELHLRFMESILTAKKLTALQRRQKIADCFVILKSEIKQLH